MCLFPIDRETLHALGGLTDALSVSSHFPEHCYSACDIRPLAVKAP